MYGYAEKTDKRTDMRSGRGRAKTNGGETRDKMTGGGENGTNTIIKIMPSFN